MSSATSQPVTNFFRQRLKYFGQIASMKKPDMLAKTESNFLSATLQFLPSVGTISPEVASSALEMLDEPCTENMTEATKTTIKESIANITDPTSGLLQG